MLRHTVVLILAMMLGACATNPVVRLYEGEPRPLAEVLRVNVPMELEVLSINERRVEKLGGLFSWGERELHLQPGTYRVVAYYKALFDLSADQHEVVKSDPAIFTVSGQQGDHFRLGFDKPATVDEARELATRFDGWTENVATGERIPTRPSGMISAGGFVGLIDAAQPVTTSDTVPPAEQLADGTAGVPASAGEDSAMAPQPATSPKTASRTAAPGEENPEGTTLDQMKTLWKDATQAERQQFLLWLKSE